MHGKVDVLFDDVEASGPGMHNIRVHGKRAIETRQNTILHNHSLL